MSKQENNLVKPGIVQYQDLIPKLYPELNREQEENGKVVTVSVTFAVTQSCNLRCTYCYQHNKNNHNAMSFETAKKSVDRLFEEYEKDDPQYIETNNFQAVILEFIGGEPLLEIELIGKIIEYFRFKAYLHDSPWLLRHMIAISTNGLLFETDEVQRFYNKYKECLSISISIDGNKRLHDACRITPEGKGSYDIVASSFKTLIESNPDAMTKMTLAPENIMYLAEAHIDLIETFDIKQIFSNVIYEAGWEIEHARIFYKELKKLADYMIKGHKYKRKSLSIFEVKSGMKETTSSNWCGGTGNMIAFDADGKFYSCLRFLPFSMNEESAPVPIGDLESGMGIKKEHKNVVQILKKITRESQSPDKCLTCEISKGCGWCSAYNYEVYGDINKRATFICEMHQARVLASAYYFNTILEMHDPERTKYKRYEMNIRKDWALEIISEEEYEMLVSLAEQEV